MKCGTATSSSRPWSLPKNARAPFSVTPDGGFVCSDASDGDDRDEATWAEEKGSGTFFEVDWEEWVDRS